MTTTFLTFLSPFTTISILSENRAQMMATIINNSEILSIFPSSNPGLYALTF